MMLIFNKVKVLLLLYVVVVLSSVSNIFSVEFGIKNSSKRSYPMALNPFDEGELGPLKAAKEGKIEELEKYLRKQSSTFDLIKIKDIYGNNLLMVAAANGQDKVVDLLFSGNFLQWFFVNNTYINMDNEQINAKNKRGNTALMLAVIGYSKTNERSKVTSYNHIIKKLLKSGADINSQNSNGVTPLMAAVALNNSFLASLLLKHGRFNPFNKNKISIDVKDNFGDTALGYACVNSSVTMVKLLLSYGADVKVRNKIGDTILMKAIRVKNEEVVKFLLSNKKVDVNASNNQGETSLMLAVAGENKAIIDVLVDYGANINAKNSEGKNFLMLSIIDDKAELFDKLFTCGSLLYLYTDSLDLNARDNEGNTALMWAAHYGRVNMIEKLLLRGMGARWLKGAVVIDMQNNNGDTALHMALHNYKYEAANKLLSLGANAYIENKQGNKPVDVIINLGNHIPQAQVLKQLVNQQRFNRMRYLMSQRANVVCKKLPKPSLPKSLGRFFGRRNAPVLSVEQ